MVVSDAALGAPLLPVGAVGRRGVGWWGLLCVLATEGALFTYLLFSYYYFAIQLPHSWIPVQPSFRLSGPDTAILLLSSVAAWWGERGVRRGARGQLLAGIAAAFLLGVAFLVIQYFEWQAKPFTFRTGPYGSLYFITTGFHMAHVAVGVIFLLLLVAWSALGYFDTRRNAPVLIGVAYWHFVDAVWLAVFTTFYVTPYLW